MFYLLKAIFEKYYQEDSRGMADDMKDHYLEEIDTGNYCHKCCVKRAQIKTSLRDNERTQNVPIAVQERKRLPSLEG